LFKIGLLATGKTAEKKKLFFVDKHPMHWVRHFVSATSVRSQYLPLINIKFSAGLFRFITDLDMMLTGEAGLNSRPFGQSGWLTR
jgi:hypothetical protein